MADNKDPSAPALDTNIESGGFNEKRAQEAAASGAAAAQAPPKTKEVPEDEEEDEDMDALIEDLESEDGHVAEEEEEEVQPGGGRVVPEDMLQTDPRVGLTESEVTTRRRKYGLNQMKEEKENLVLKFLGFFIGPIQFVMEVSHYPAAPTTARTPVVCRLNNFGRRNYLARLICYPYSTIVCFIALCISPVIVN